MLREKLYFEGKNFKVYTESGLYFLFTTDGYEQEYCYKNELIRDINRGYVQDYYKGIVTLIK